MEPPLPSAVAGLAPRIRQVSKAAASPCRLSSSVVLAAVHFKKASGRLGRSAKSRSSDSSAASDANELCGLPRHPSLEEVRAVLEAPGWQAVPVRDVVKMLEENGRADILPSMLRVLADRTPLDARDFTEGVFQTLLKAKPRVIDLHGLSEGAGQLAVRWWLSTAVAPELTSSAPFGCSVITGYGKTRKEWDTTDLRAAIIKTLQELNIPDRQVLTFDLSHLRSELAPTSSTFSGLKMQTRSVCCFPDKSGFALGGIEGRCWVKNLEDSSKSFTFKCHQFPDSARAVNALDVHAAHPSLLATAGGDGSFIFWQKADRKLLKRFEPSKVSLTAGKFNSSGYLFAYAVSYDWSKGHEAFREDAPRQVGIHQCRLEELAYVT
ncbi:unnamed protein product [Effrenium voratum]|nr:unnamed protein product [Effrenium voratum]